MPRRRDHRRKAARTARTRRSGAYALSTPRLVVVDVEDRLAAYLRALLGDHPPVVACASIEAARAALGAPNRFCAVITEADLPDGSGFDVAAAARSADPTLPVMILARRGSRGDQVRAFRAGVRYLPRIGDVSHVTGYVLFWLREHGRTLDHRRLAALARAKRTPLTNSARDTLYRLADGIARAELRVSVGCGKAGIDKRVAELKQTFHVDSIAQLVGDLDAEGAAIFRDRSEDELSTLSARLGRKDSGTFEVGSTSGVVQDDGETG